MTAKDHILCAVEAELKLLRELGVRVVEGTWDRESGAVNAVNAAKVADVKPSPAASPAFRNPVAESPAPEQVVFLHHAPLSAEAAEIVEKASAALGWNCKVVTGGALPPAKLYIALGSEAVKRFFSGERAAPYTYLKSRTDVFVTKSPELIVKNRDPGFVKKLKVELWTGLKGVKQRHEI